MTLSKTYQPQKIEEEIYTLWQEKTNNFKTQTNSKNKPFTIIMPPPNANESLHVGHALMISVEDLMIRYKRMRGYEVLWLPGTDHAGIESQTVYEKKLEAKGDSRFNYTRKEFYDNLYNYCQVQKSVIISQIKKLGASCDWNQEHFTLEPKILEEVNKTFIKLYKDNLIYYGNYLVNWCSRCSTAISDLEVKHKDEKTKLYYFKYLLREDEAKKYNLKYFELATVRPETKFGDTAIAVHPKDKRYKHLVGKTIHAIGVQGKTKLKIIADNLVDRKFGTGCVKVTPAHDPNDYEMGLRHNLPIISVIDKEGKMNEKAGKYKGMSIKEARKAVVEEMKRKNLITKIEDYNHSVAICGRCGTVIEPSISKQLFLKVKPLAKKAIEVLDNNEITVYPPQFKKILRDWYVNLKDWCISRQIVWGPRIPLWIGKPEEKTKSNLKTLKSDIKYITSLKKPSEPGYKFTQTSDTFDTWFSSGQWPYTTLGFHNNGKHSKNFEKFFPTDVMETARDILPLWVSRMIMLSLYRTKKIPFKNIYFHGLVTDKEGKKMSKSKGNVVNPLSLMKKYGTDALRMALLSGNTPGINLKLSNENIEKYRNFANKIWNITRYFKSQHASLNNLALNENFDTSKLTIPDKWILHHTQKLIKDVTKHFENYRFSQASILLYEFTWHKLADVYIEASKDQFKNKKKTTLSVLNYVIKTVLKILHPYMPFLTEHIYTNILKNKNKSNLLMTSPWPKENNNLIFKNIDQGFYNSAIGAKEKQRLTKELNNLQNYIKILNKKLSNKNFLSNAPKNIIDENKKALRETKEKIKLLNNERVK